MLTISDLKTGVVFVMDGNPWEVLEAHHVLLGRGRGHLETKIRNLKTASVLTRTFKQADRFEEADVNYRKVAFVYARGGKFFFADPNNRTQRFELTEEHVGEARWYLTENLPVELLRFGDEVLGVRLPPKVTLKVTEAEPWIRGDTATAGTKNVVVETGIKVKTPHFIEEGNLIRVNTKTGEYVERVEK